MEVKLLLVTEFYLPASGYQTIAEGLGLELAAAGHELLILGQGYAGQQHDYPFRVVPTDLSWVPQELVSLEAAWQPDHILLMVDVSKALAIARNIEKHFSAWPTEHALAAAFPVESDPFPARWVRMIKRYFPVRFTFTAFGLRELAVAGVSAFRLPVGLQEGWYTLPPAEVAAGLELILPEGRYVLSVAENHLRKNWPAQLEVFWRTAQRRAEAEPSLHYVLVTNPDSPDGWDLEDLAAQLGIPRDRYTLLRNRHLLREQLKVLFLRAAVLLHLPLAEGIGLPLYEAAALGLPIVANGCCAIPEALAREPGEAFTPNWLVPPERKSVFTFGNSHHYWPSIEGAVEALNAALDEASPAQPRHWPTWAPAARRLEQILAASRGILEGLPHESQASSVAEPAPGAEAGAAELVARAEPALAE